MSDTEAVEKNIGGGEAKSLKTISLKKLSWAVGGAADNLIVNTINAIALPIYNIGMGVDAVMLGYALAIPRVLDAVSDSYIGHLSDNTRSRWGRRRPFIVLGAIIAGIFCMLMWAPPLWLLKITVLKQPAILWYFLIVSSIYYFGYAMFVIPYSALGFELSTDFHERTRIQGLKFFFLASAGFLLPWLYRISIYLGEHYPIAGVKPEVAGVRLVGFGMGLLIIVMAGLPGFLCREDPRNQTQSKIEFLKAVKLTIQNKYFVVLCVAVFVIQASLFVVNPFSIYLWIYYVTDSNKEMASNLYGYMGTANALLGLIVIGFVTWLSRKAGKKETMLIGSVIALAGTISTWFLFTPKHPYWSILPQLIMCPGLTCIYVLGPSMLADICDVDELKSGMRREGMFNAAFAFLFKCGFSVVTVLTGYMLRIAGYMDNVLPNAAVVRNLRLLFMLVPAGGILITIALLMFYRLDEKKLRAIRAQLDARHKELNIGN